MKPFNTKERFSIPNLMGYFRLLLIPVFCYLYLAKEAYHWAAGVVLLSSLTDLFDGMIARKFNMITNLGKALDPIADKLTHGALALCLAFRYPQMWVLFGLMVLKEGYMVVMGLLFLRKGKMLNLKISYAYEFLHTRVTFLSNDPFEDVNGFPFWEKQKCNTSAYLLLQAGSVWSEYTCIKTTILFIWSFLMDILCKEIR